MIGTKRARLSAVAMAVALGFMCGAFKLIVAQLALYGKFVPQTVEMVTRWGGIFPGVEASMTGSFVAGAWGFLTGFFAGLIFSWIYNLCLCCCPGCCPCCKGASCGNKAGECAISTEKKL